MRPATEEQFLLWFSISEDIHDHIKCNHLIGFGKKRLLVIGDKIEIVEIVELVDKRGLWKRLCTVINEPASHVPI